MRSNYAGKNKEERGSMDSGSVHRCAYVARVDARRLSAWLLAPTAEVVLQYQASQAYKIPQSPPKSQPYTIPRSDSSVRKNANSRSSIKTRLRIGEIFIPTDRPKASRAHTPLAAQRVLTERKTGFEKDPRFGTSQPSGACYLKQGSGVGGLGITSCDDDLISCVSASHVAEL
ncbi:hypothetical protein Q7P35_000997 [Cladosporium inversicolor]